MYYFINRTIKFTILYALQIACVLFNSWQNKTLNKGDIKLLEKKGEEKKYNNIQKETTDFSLLSNMAFNFFFLIYFVAYFSGWELNEENKMDNRFCTDASIH